MTDATAGHLITNGCRLRSLRSLRRTRLALRAASAPWNVNSHPPEQGCGAGQRTRPTSPAVVVVTMMMVLGVTTAVGMEGWRV